MYVLKTKLNPPIEIIMIEIMNSVFESIFSIRIPGFNNPASKIYLHPST